MFRYFLSGSVVVLIAISFLQADISATQTREKQAGTTPEARLSVEEETELGNFVLDLLEADEGGNNIHRAIEGKIQQIRNGRAVGPAARAAQGGARRQARKSSDRVEGPGRRGAKPAAKAAGGGARGRGRGRGTGPGNAMRHGLQNKDVPGLGRFANTLLAQGLQGQRLTEAIRTEITRRKHQRRAGPG